MTQNIFHGGDELNLRTREFCHRETGCVRGLQKIAFAIQRSGADAVGLQEPEMNTQTIADLLGWYASPRTSIISRYPLIDPSGGNGVYVYAELSPGRYVALANTHLPSDPYGPYLVRDGGTLQQVLQLERTARLPFIADQLRELPPLAAAGVPVFLTGDFNSPSSLDWTAAVAAVRSDVHYPVKWPVSDALRRVGFARLVPRDPSRPDRGAGLHVDARRPGGGPARGVRPDRLGAAHGAGADDRQPDRRRAGWARCRRRGRAVAVRPPRRGVDIPRGAGRAAGVRRRQPAV